jgi:uncharacterized protein YkwD
MMPPRIDTISAYPYRPGHGAWLSLVERRVWDAEVAGSNPAAPIDEAGATCAPTSVAGGDADSRRATHHSPVHRLLIASLAVLALAAPSGAAAQAPSCPGADLAPAADTVAAIGSATLCLLNQQRTSRGLAPLRLDRKLSAASQAYSQAMVAGGFFDHVSPVDRSTPQGRARAARYIPRSGTWRLGENIAWGSGELATAAQIVAAWMHSPGHRHNILTRAFRDVGIGIALGAPEPQSAELPAATYTTDFGARR